MINTVTDCNVTKLAAQRNLGVAKSVGSRAIAATFKDCIGSAALSASVISETCGAISPDKGDRYHSLTQRYRAGIFAIALLELGLLDPPSQLAECKMNHAGDRRALIVVEGILKAPFVT